MTAVRPVIGTLLLAVGAALMGCDAGEAPDRASMLSRDAAPWIVRDR